MTDGSGRGVTETAQEVYELCCEPGAVIKYQTLRLEKLSYRADHDRWRVTRSGEYVDTINTSAFFSASQLQLWLDAVAEGDSSDAEGFCADCLLRPIPGD